MIVSSKDFLGSTALFDGRGLYPDAASRAGRLADLLRAAPDVELRPILHIRRTSGFLASCLSQETTKGRGIDRRALRRTVDPGGFRWRDLVAALESEYEQDLAGLAPTLAHAHPRLVCGAAR